jgi:hypothetical protein
MQLFFPLKQGQKIKPSIVGCFNIVTMKTQMY